MLNRLMTWGCPSSRGFFCRRLSCTWILPGLLAVSLNSGSVAQEVPDELWQELQFLDFKGATDSFRDLRASADPGSREYAEATLGLALCLHQRQPDVQGDKEQAGALYAELAAASETPDALAAHALLMHGRLHQLVDYFKDQPDPDAAVAAYNELMNRFPGRSIADLAALYRAQVGVFSMDPDSARKAVEQLRGWMEQRGDRNTLTSIHWMLVGQAMSQPIQNIPEAITAYENALAEGLPRNTKLDNLYWIIANLCEQSGQDQKAIRYYARIIEEEQRSVYGYASQERIRKLGGTPPELVDPFAGTGEGS